jgi:flagellar hook-associated protein 2
MASFSFSGAISGLDTASMITALMDAEKLPLTRLQSQRTSLQGTQTAYGTLKGLLLTLQTRAKAFTTDGAGARRLATSSNAPVLTATAAVATTTGSYTVTVDHLATATKATSAAPMGTAVTTADLDTFLSSLALPGSVSAGTLGMVVDGRVVRATIGDPTTTTLRQATDAIAAALQAQIQTNEGSGSTATVTASIVGNKLQFALSGTSTTHALSFGVGGDTSNAAGVFGLAGTGSVSLDASTPMTARSVLGVARTTGALDLAGLTGLTSGAGTLTINGTAVAYDTAVDSLSAVISRINTSPTGVVASLDRGNDRIILTSRSGGAAPIGIEDTGTLAAALQLRPGTTDAQVLGSQAEVTVDGRTYLSDTNRSSTAIDGVTLNLLALGTSTVTVAPDNSATSSAISGLVSAFNTLADQLDTLTVNDPKKTRGALAGETGVRDMSLSFRLLLTGRTASGSIGSLADIGITTGVLGSSLGTTSRLVFDEAKLTAALEKDPSAVATLLNGATGAIAPLAEAIDGWTKSNGRISTAVNAVGSNIKTMTGREEQMNARLATRQAALEKQFASLEKRLAELQVSSNATTAQINSMTGSSG